MGAEAKSISKRVDSVSESGTTRLFGAIRDLRNSGRRILSLAIGEPDFDAPAEVIAAAKRALDEGATRYGPVAGEAALRASLAAEFKGYGPRNVIVTNGAKQGLYSVFQALCDPGDEVIVPSPAWVSFGEQIRLSGGRPVYVPTPGGALDTEAIERAITPNTKAILVNTPNNPTGAVYSREALSRVAVAAAERGLFLVVDESYNAIVFDGFRHERLFDLCLDRERLITVRSFSKHYNMTGFRLGYVAADALFVSALERLQSHLCGNVCTFAQYGAMAALEMDGSAVEGRRVAIQRLRDMAHSLASEFLDCPRPEGAFYLFPNVSRYLKPGETSDALAMALLGEASVAVVPGEAFGAPGHLRISYTLPEAELREAFSLMRAFFETRQAR